MLNIFNKRISDMLNIFNKKKNQKKVARSTPQTYYIKLEIRYGVSCEIFVNNKLKKRLDYIGSLKEL
jgi:hypothetical protein